MKFSEFKRYKPKSAGNVFVLVCEDSFLIDESRAVWSRIFGGDWRFEKLQAREFQDIDWSRLSDEALTPSLFAQNRAILVAGADKLSTERAEELPALENIPRSTLKLVLLCDNAKSVKSWMKRFPVIEIEQVRPGEAARWLAERYGLGPDVARYLVETVGADLQLLQREMEKLLAYVGERRTIEVKDVDAVTLRIERFAPFDLDDAIFARDYNKAARVLGAMLEDGVEHLRILAQILRVWRQLFVAKGLLGRRGAKDVAAAVGAPYWKAPALAEACGKYEWKQLARGFRELLNADRAFKTSSPDPAAFFDVLLWKLVTPQSGH